MKDDDNPFQDRNVPKEMDGSWAPGRQGAEQEVLQYTKQSLSSKGDATCKREMDRMWVMHRKWCKQETWKPSKEISKIKQENSWKKRKLDEVE